MIGARSRPGGLLRRPSARSCSRDACSANCDDGVLGLLDAEANRRQNVGRLSRRWGDEGTERQRRDSDRLFSRIWRARRAAKKCL
jgi:hypothetical protein